MIETRKRREMYQTKLTNTNTYFVANREMKTKKG